MYFSVTKEIGWEADDDDDGFKPAFGVRKRYRFVLDFTRNPSKNRREGKSIDSEHNKDVDNNSSCLHYCYGCNAPRSEQYQQQFPPKRGRIPRPSLCTRCRYYREIRIADRTRGSRGRRRTDKLTARIDEREWCANCGTLRSSKYHSELLSGKLFVRDEICSRCILIEERKGERGQFRTSYQGKHAVSCGEDDQHDLPDRSNLQGRRSRPYGITSTPSRDEVKLVLGTSSTTSDSQTGGWGRKESSFDESGQVAAKATSSEDACHDSVNVGNIHCYASKSEVSKDGQEQDWPARQRDKGGSRGERRQQQNGRRESTEKFEEPRLRVVPLTAVNLPSRKSPKSHSLCAGQKESKDTGKACLPAVSNMAGSTSRSPGEKGDREDRVYFKPPYVKGWYKKHTQVKVESRPVEPHEGPNVASSPVEYQGLQESREYFKLPPQQQQKNNKNRIETHWWPTAANSRVKPNAGGGEKHSDRQGHQKHQPTSSTRATRPKPQERELFCFELHGQDEAQPKLTPFTDCHSSTKHHDSQTQHKAQPPVPPHRQQQKHKQQRKQRQPRPMGVSDMYWASAHGRAEQASSAGANGEVFFPHGGGAVPFVSAKPTATAFSHSHGGDGGGAPPHRRGAERKKKKKQVWEVDSDEADKIERDHARLVAALEEEKVGAGAQRSWETAYY